VQSTKQMFLPRPRRSALQQHRHGWEMSFDLDAGTINWKNNPAAPMAAVRLHQNGDGYKSVRTAQPVRAGDILAEFGGEVYDHANPEGSLENWLDQGLYAMPRPRALKCDTPEKRKAVHTIYWFGHAFLRHFLLSDTIIHAFRAIFSAKTCLQGRRPSSCAMQSQRSRFPEGECRTIYLICGPLDEGTRYLFDFECRRNIFT
jgi:hypothetical protein